MMRSWLFVPGNRPNMIEKARNSEADVLILDLEDSVAPREKDEARRYVLAALQEPRGNNRLWVRINPLSHPDIARDVETALVGGADGIVLPKALGGDSLDKLIEITAAQRKPCPPVLAIATESAGAIFGLGSYGGYRDTLIGLTWGAEDLSADLGSSTSRDEAGELSQPYALARNMMLFGAVTAMVQPIDSVWTDIRDLHGLERECLIARRDGFTGKLAIHPAQVPVINRCFQPSEEDVALARRIIAAFETEPDMGVVSIDGQMIDMPHLKRSRRILAQAGEQK